MAGRKAASTRKGSVTAAAKPAAKQKHVAKAKAASKARSKPKARPKSKPDPEKPSRFKTVSEEMARYADLVGQELLTWPQVEQKRMFGCSAYMRKGRMFAALPATRDFFQPNMVAFKFHRQQPCPARLRGRLESDERVAISGTFQNWINFFLRDDRDFRDFLEYCAYAHEDAK